MNKFADLMNQNFMRNNMTGQTFDFGPSQPVPANAPQRDYSQVPVDIAGVGTGYRVKGDPYSLVLADGRKVTFDFRSQQDKLKDLQIAQAEANVRKTNADISGANYGSNPDEYNNQLDYWANVIKNGGSMPPGLARGKAGSEFVRDVTKRAALGNVSPEELMSNQAEFLGEKAGQRTVGTRQANIQIAATEANKMMPIALEASNAVNRTQYPTLNSILLAVEKGTGDENVVRLATANNAIINAYSRAISPSGVPTVHDKQHAREILESAYSKGQYAAAIDMMQREMAAALASPASVKSSMRDLALGKNKPGQTGVPRISTDAEYNQLPSGTEFIAPDGSHRRKP